MRKNAFKYEMTFKIRTTQIQIFTKQNQMRHNLNETQLNTKQFKYKKKLNTKYLKYET